MVSEEKRIIAAKGNLSMPEIRRLANEGQVTQNAKSESEQMARELADSLVPHLEKKTPEERARIRRVWKDPNFQYQIANNPQLVLRWILVGENFGKVHHSFGAALYGVTGSADNLELMMDGMKGPDVEAARKAIKVIQRGIGDIAGIYSSLHSTMASGRKIENNEIDLSRIINDVQTSAMLTAILPNEIREHVKFQTNIQDDLGPIITDRHRVYLALFNSMSNSIQAIENKEMFEIVKGERIDINVRKEVRDGQDWMRLEVSDTGCGFDPSQKNRIFEYFHTRKGDRGTGLGVPTTRDIVQELGGEYDINSLGVGKGAKVTILLPMKPKDSVLLV